MALEARWALFWELDTCLSDDEPSKLVSHLDALYQWLLLDELTQEPTDKSVTCAIGIDDL